MRIAVVVESGKGSTPFHGVHTFMIHQQTMLKKFGIEIDFIFKKPKAYYAHSPAERQALLDFKVFGRCYFPKGNSKSLLYCLTEKNEYSEFYIKESLDLYLQKQTPDYIFFHVFLDIFQSLSILNHYKIPVLYFNHSPDIYLDKQYFIDNFHDKLLQAQKETNFTMLMPNSVIDEYMQSIGYNTQPIMTPFNFEKCYNIGEQEGIIAIGCGIERKRTKETLMLLDEFQKRTGVPCTVLSPEIEYQAEYPNITIKQVPNNEVVSEISKHKILLHLASNDMMPMVFLEAAPVTQIVVSNMFDWNSGIVPEIPLIRIQENVDQLQQVYSIDKLKFDHKEYQHKAEKMWKELLGL